MIFRDYYLVLFNFSLSSNIRMYVKQKISNYSPLNSLFFFQKLIIRAHESLARLAVMHIVVTNLCVW